METLFPNQKIKKTYLWRRSEVNNSLQLNFSTELLHKKGMPVLVHCPLGKTHAPEFKLVLGKNVPD